MGADNTSRIKSKKFAVRIIGLYKRLISEKKEFVLARQILRSGTSIGANLAEAECAISRREFLAKQYISLKECMETIYWLELLHETDFITTGEFEGMIADCEELRKMLSASTKTLRKTIER